MTIKNIIKNGVYENIVGGSGVSPIDIVVILGLALLFGLYVYFVYRQTSKVAFYSKDLNMTLAGMPIVVAAIMLAMQSNLLVSLGMVGALSIVRFRNAVKNPLDLLYLFWAISVGIICGVGLYLLVAILCVVMTVFVIVLSVLPATKANSLLVISADYACCDLDELRGAIKKWTTYRKEKSTLVKRNELELIVEIRCSKSRELIESLNTLEGVLQINYLSHDGVYRV